LEGFHGQTLHRASSPDGDSAELGAQVWRRMVIIPQDPVAAVMAPGFAALRSEFFQAFRCQ
jgi:hypothetical protein